MDHTPERTSFRDVWRVLVRNYGTRLGRPDLSSQVPTPHSPLCCFPLTPVDETTWVPSVDSTPPFLFPQSSRSPFASPLLTKVGHYLCFLFPFVFGATPPVTTFFLRSSLSKITLLLGPGRSDRGPPFKTLQVLSPSSLLSDNFKSNTYLPRVQDLLTRLLSFVSFSLHFLPKFRINFSIFLLFLIKFLRYTLFFVIFLLFSWDPFLFDPHVNTFFRSIMDKLRQISGPWSFPWPRHLKEWSVKSLTLKTNVK